MAVVVERSEPLAVLLALDTYPISAIGSAIYMSLQASGPTSGSWIRKLPNTTAAPKGWRDSISQIWSARR